MTKTQRIAMLERDLKKFTAKGRSLKLVVMPHRCQYQDDQMRQCRSTKTTLVTVFLDSTCHHGSGCCKVWACGKHHCNAA